MLVTVRALALPHIRHDDDDDDDDDVVDVEFGDDVANETTVKFRSWSFSIPLQKIFKNANSREPL